MADKSHAGAAPSQTCFMCSVPSLSRSDSPGPEVEDDPRTSELKKVSGSRRRVPERESSDYSHPLWETAGVGPMNWEWLMLLTGSSGVLMGLMLVANAGPVVSAAMTNANCERAATGLTERYSEWRRARKQI